LDDHDCENLDVVGIYPNYASALDAWRGTSQKHVDNPDIRHRAFAPADGARRRVVKTPEGREVLVPAVEDIVIDIDIDGKLMTIQLIEGLL